MRAYRRVTTAGGLRAAGGRVPERLLGADGSLEIHGRLAPEDGALLLRALDAMRDPLWQEARAVPRNRGRCGRHERGGARRRRRRRAHPPEASRPGGERYQVVVHVDEPCPRNDGEGGCELEDGSALALGDGA